MQAQSGSTPDEPVDHRGEHLALKSTQRRAFAHVQVVVKPADGDSEVEILRQDLEDTRDYSSILSFVCPVQHFAHPSGSLRVYGKDTSHAGISFLPPHQARTTLLTSWGYCGMKHKPSYPPNRLFFRLIRLIHRSAQNRNSRKFAVAN